MATISSRNLVDAVLVVERMGLKDRERLALEEKPSALIVAAMHQPCSKLCRTANSLCACEYLGWRV